MNLNLILGGKNLLSSISLIAAVAVRTATIYVRCVSEKRKKKCICPARARNAGSGLYTKFDQNYIINMNCTEVYIM